jgi:hypothetical protein
MTSLPPLDEERARRLHEQNERLNGKRAPKRTILLTNAAEVTDENVSWFWKPYIPRAMLVALVGNEGAGKTTFECLVAGRATCGDLPDQTEPERVLIIGDEDSWSMQWKPQLRLAGADLTLIDFARAGYEGDEDGMDDSITLPDDVGVLEEKIEGTYRLVIIDPLESHMKGAKSAFDPAENRRLQAPLVRLANRTGATIIGAVHTNRDKSTSSRARMGGSSTKRHSARHLLVLGWSPDEPDEKSSLRMLIPDKSNLIAPHEKVPIGLKLDGDGHGHGVMEVGEEAEFTVKQIFDATDRAAGVEKGTDGLSKTKLAEIVIEEAFAHDVTDGHTINKRLTARGVETAARRARKKLGIKVKQNHEGTGGPGALEGSRTTWYRDEIPL